MTIVSRVFNGKIAIWEKPLTGDPLAPFNDPSNHIDLIKFHSDLQYLANTLESTTTINHTSLAGVTGTGYTVSNAGGSSGSSQPISNGQVRVSDLLLYTHGLGYAPLTYVIVDDQLITPGLTIQNLDDRWRGVSVYATTTGIYLREVAISSVSALPTVSKSYRVIIFREPTADPALPTFHVKPADGIFVMGRGKINQDTLPIRRVVPGDPFAFYIPIDRIADIRNGALRIINSDGLVVTLGQYNGPFNQTQTIQVTY